MGTAERHHLEPSASDGPAGRRDPAGPVVGDGVDREAVEARFWPKVERGEGCWRWLGGTFDNGYGKFYLDGHQYRAHRIAYELATGQPAAGLTLRHTCENRLCVRPDHLVVGTTRRAPRSSARITRGEHSHFSKLSEHDVREIRRLFADGGITQRALAQRYHVTIQTIQSIVYRKTWKHVDL